MPIPIPDNRSTWEKLKCPGCSAPAVNCRQVPVCHNGVDAVVTRVTAACGNILENGEWGLNDSHYYSDCCEWIVETLEKLLKCGADEVIGTVKQLIFSGEHNKFAVPASVNSDDWEYDVEFDALPWLEQATDEAIEKLWECECGGDYPADEVAQFMEDRNSDIAVLLEHCRNNREMGFECHVNKEQLWAWVVTHRPDVGLLVDED